MIEATTEELAQTAKELARWQGRTDEVIAAHSAHFLRLNGSLDRVAESLQAIEKHIAGQTQVDTVLEEVQENRRKFRMWFTALSVTVFVGLSSTVFAAVVAVVVAVVVGE